MEEYQNTQRKIAFVSLVIIGICLFVILFGPRAEAQSSQARDHAKLQREYSFEARMKSNTAFGMANAKTSLKHAKNKRKEQAKKERYASRIEAIRNKTLAVK